METMKSRDILLAYLHDPPDKALGIAGHERRGRKAIQAALGEAVTTEEVKGPSDPLAAIAERMPAPKWQVLTVNPQGNQLTVHHPLSPSKRELHCRSWDEEQVSRVIADLVSGVDDTGSRFLLVWRRLAEKLAAEGREWYLCLPADTRTPDHTIWHHLDITAGLKGAEVDSALGASFLSFSLGPVQAFIAAARTVRDLWSGSMILSWITFQAMMPIVKRLGPTAFVYPSLRGLPWVDLWLRQQPGLGDGKIPSPDVSHRLTPCLPNRFLALVPWGPDGQTAAQLAADCEQAARLAWSEIATSVRRDLKPRLDCIAEGWDRRWDDQVESYFDVRTAILPWRDCRDDEACGKLIAGAGGFADAFPDASAIRQLAAAIPDQDRPPYDQNSAGSWQAKVELSARLMQALRAVRHIPAAADGRSPGEKFPAKCSLLGSYEQVGPEDFDRSAGFWKEAGKISLGGVRLRERERLCAVALVKRFSGPCYFKRQLQLEMADLRYEDTATVAAAEWLKAAGVDPDHERRTHREGWSGQWLHWPKRDFDPDDRCPDDLWQVINESRRQHGRPPVYYAVLVMDGDEMGKWLRGEKSPHARRAMHEDLVRYFERLPGTVGGLDARRPVGPALHAALSEALMNFALHFVPQIIEKHLGTLIYAGGDDVLALLPTNTALRCAAALRQVFRRDWCADRQGHERLLLGNEATVSAGLAIVHYKEDLQSAIQIARETEKAAKNAGRDALEITACRRSGGRETALCPWEFVEHVQGWIAAFGRGPNNDATPASDRWAYHLSTELPTLQGLPVDAMQAEIGRQVARSERQTRERLGETRDRTAASILEDEFAAYCRLVINDKRKCSAGDALDQFVTLGKTASFLARGKDE